MEVLRFQANSILEELPKYYAQLERCPPEESLHVENEIKSRLNAVHEKCRELDILVNKEQPQRRMAARNQLEQLKYDCRHYQASLNILAQRRLARDKEHREREELLSRRFTTNDADTSIEIDHSIVQNRSLQNAHRSMDELIGTGSTVLENLRDQKDSLKGAHKKIMDIANTLGLSNTVMRLIEKRTYVDKYILIIGMIVTCIFMILIYKYLT